MIVFLVNRGVLIDLLDGISFGERFSSTAGFRRRFYRIFKKSWNLSEGNLLEVITQFFAFVLEVSLKTFDDLEDFFLFHFRY